MNHASSLFRRLLPLSPDRRHLPTEPREEAKARIRCRRKFASLNTLSLNSSHHQALTRHSFLSCPSALPLVHLERRSTLP